MSNALIARHGRVAVRNEILAQDLRRVVGDADELLQELVNAGADEFATVRERVQTRLGEVESNLKDARREIAHRTQVASELTQDYIRENPWKLAGAAVAAGLLAVLLLSRR